jgi:sporulation protein YlmC with PRC-barrel domain
MKKILFIIILLVFIAKVSSYPLIEDFTIEPDELWVGDTPKISLKCQDNSHEITSVYSYIRGPYMIFPKLDLTKIDQEYILWPQTIKLYIDSETKGQFIVDVYCVNDINQTNTTSGVFTLSNIYMDLNSITSNPSYIGDVIEVNLDVKKESLTTEKIKSYDIDFHVFLNGQLVDFRPTQPYYDERRGWVLRFNSPEDEGEYDLEIKANYKEKSISYKDKLIVKDPIQFEITRFSNNREYKKDVNITLEVRAYNKDEKIYLKKEHLSFEIDSALIDTDNFFISSKNTYDEITIKPESFSAGKYDLEVNFNYMHFSSQMIEKIYFVKSLSGKIINHDDNPLNSELVFKSDYIEKSIKTENNGSYYGFLCPGKYDFTGNFPQSRIELEDLNMQENQFSDPITYNYLGEFDLGGIRTAGVFFYDINPDFKDGKIEMNYNSRDVRYEDKLKVYRCEDWDSTDKVCEDSWEEIEDFEIYEKDNRITIDAWDSSAYAIGNKKSLDPSFSINKQSYYLSDGILIDGLIRDDMHNPVGDAIVNVILKGTGVSKKIESSSNGIVTTEFTSPDKEGNYTLLIEVIRDPYDNFETQIQIEVLKKEELSMVTPDSIRLEQGEKSSIDVSIINIGQADLADIDFSITDIPNRIWCNHGKFFFL